MAYRSTPPVVLARRSSPTSPFPPCGGRLGWGVPPHERLVKQENVRVKLKRSYLGSCGGTPHPATPKLAPLAKAPHPSPTRGKRAASSSHSSVRLFLDLQ